MTSGKTTRRASLTKKRFKRPEVQVMARLKRKPSLLTMGKRVKIIEIRVRKKPGFK